MFHKIFILFIICVYFARAIEECNWNYGIPGSKNDPARRNLIVGGGTADEDEYGWQVQFSNGCGGTVIGREWILTAAHCNFDNLGSITVELAYQTFQRETVSAIAVYKHEAFIPETVEHDIALVKVSPMNCGWRSDGLEAIGLASFASIDLAGCTAFITGAGATSYGGSNAQFGQVHEVISTVLDWETCRRTGYGSLVKESNICALSAEGGEDACQGDSGGPLKIDKEPTTSSHEYVQAGIISFGKECAILPGVYTWIGHYEEWIKNIYENATFIDVTVCDQNDYIEGGGTDWVMVALMTFAAFIFACIVIIIFGKLIFEVVTDDDEDDSRLPNKRSAGGVELR